MTDEHEWKLQTLERLAEEYLGPKRGLVLTPLLAASIFCGVTWGILGVQFLKWIARRAKGERAATSLFAGYLVLASTAYLGLFSAFISYFFAQNFGRFAMAFDLVYSSWLFLIATVFIHAPCQAFYARYAYKLSGNSKILGLVLLVLIGGIVGIGATLKAILADVIVNLTWIQSFLIKFWIALTTATDLVLTGTIAYLHMTGKSTRYTNATFLQKVRYLVVDGQLATTLISVGLLVLLMVEPSSSITHLWLGLPLIYPINVFGTLDSRRALRDDVEAAAVQGDARRESTVSTASEKDEKPRIPPAEGRPSFLLSPFPTIALRRASNKITQYTAPIIMPAISGVRRASQFLGVIPPMNNKPAKKRTFPFRKTTGSSSSGRNSPVELHPSSLAYPLSQDAAPMGESELVPRGKALDRQHSLVLFEQEPGLAVTLGQPSVHPSTPCSETAPGQPALSDPFSPRSSRSPSPRPPTMSEALEAHEIFEMPSTPDMMSPKSGNSPMLVDSPVHDDVNPGWK